MFNKNKRVSFVEEQSPSDTNNDEGPEQESPQFPVESSMSTQY